MSAAYSESEIAAMKQWLRDGLSGGKMAAMLTAARGQRVSRSQIMGKVFRDPVLREIGFAHKPGGGEYAAKKDADWKPAPRKAPTPRQAPEPKPIVVKPKVRPSTARVDDRASYDRDAGHVALLQLGPRECRWPVNEAEPGELHLFCGCPAMLGRPYCQPHTERSIRPVNA